MKKWLFVILMVAVLTFTGCANKSATTDPASANNAENAQEKESSSGQEKKTSYEVELLEDGSCRIVKCNCTDQKIVVPETVDGKTVTCIGAESFAMLPAKHIVLPDTIETIEYAAFSGCKELQEIQLGTSLKNTGDLAFNHCSSLESVTFPEGMTSMGDTPFVGCTSIHEVYIPASVTEFGGTISFKDLTPDIVIVTPSGSAAEAAAQEIGLPVKNA